MFWFVKTEYNPSRSQYALVGPKRGAWLKLNLTNTKKSWVGSRNQKPMKICFKVLFSISPSRTKNILVGPNFFSVSKLKINFVRLIQNWFRRPKVRIIILRLIKTNKCKVRSQVFSEVDQGKISVMKWNKKVTVCSVWYRMKYDEL